MSPKPDIVEKFLERFNVLWPEYFAALESTNSELNSNGIRAILQSMPPSFSKTFEFRTENDWKKVALYRSLEEAFIDAVS